MHSYINNSEIIELIQNDRKGIIIDNIVTSDIDEYINSLYSVLAINNINTNVFTQPKIKAHKNKRCYTLLLIVRSNNKIGNNEFNNIVNIVNSIVPCKSINQWMHDNYCNNHHK